STAAPSLRTSSSSSLISVKQFADLAVQGAQPIQVASFWAAHLVVTFLCRVQKRRPSCPLMFPAPKAESFHPANPNGSRGTGTPTFTPHIPASTRSITRRATSPLEV